MALKLDINKQSLWMYWIGLPLPYALYLWFSSQMDWVDYKMWRLMVTALALSLLLEDYDKEIFSLSLPLLCGRSFPCNQEFPTARIFGLQKGSSFSHMLFAYDFIIFYKETIEESWCSWEVIALILNNQWTIN